MTETKKCDIWISHGNPCKITCHNCMMFLHKNIFRFLMTDYEYQRTLMIGGVIAASFTILAFYMLKPQNPSVTPKSNFAVVDTYKGCKVIQWNNGMQVEFKYFLDCSK